MSTDAPAGALASSEITLSSGFVDYPWEGVARLVHRARNLDGLREHGLHLLAAAMLADSGRPPSTQLAADVHHAQLLSLAGSALLKRVRAVCTGPVVVFKGLEVAASYPAPALRPFNDVDVLVPDAEAVQSELLEAGFRPVGPGMDWDSLHHLERLAPPDLPLSVEVHRRAKWIAGLPQLPVEDVLADAVPSATGINGVLGPSPAMHAVLLAAHAWAERPLGRISDLLDLVSVTRGRLDGDAADLAARYGMSRVWETTVRAAECLLHDRQPTWPLRSWARHLPQVRERTVFESHLERVLAPFSGFPPGVATHHAGRALARTIRPKEEESWSDKLARTRRAFRNATALRSEHERTLDVEQDDHK